MRVLLLLYQAEDRGAPLAPGTAGHCYYQGSNIVTRVLQVDTLWGTNHGREQHRSVQSPVQCHAQWTRGVIVRNQKSSVFDNFTLNNLLDNAKWELKTISQIQIGTHEERLNLHIIKSSSMINFEDKHPWSGPVMNMISIDDKIVKLYK